MSQRLTLAVAKEVAKNEKIFLNGENLFSIFDGGKYASGCTFIVSTEWGYDKNGKLQSPVIFRKLDKYTWNINLDFDSDDLSVLFGNYRLSKTGNPVLKIVAPNKATHVMVKAEWGGCFNRYRGQASNPDPNNIVFFRHARSNGGGTGTDYYIMPVGYSIQQDVSDLLEEFAKQILQEEDDNEKIFLRKEKERQEEAERQAIAADCKDEFLDVISPYVEQLHEAEDRFHNHDEYDSILEIKASYMTIVRGALYFNREHEAEAVDMIKQVTASFENFADVEERVQNYYESTRVLREYCEIQYSKCRNAFTIQIKSNGLLNASGYYLKYEKTLYVTKESEPVLEQIKEFVRVNKRVWDEMDSCLKSETEQALISVTNNIGTFSIDDLRALKEAVDNALKNKGALT